MLKNKKKGFSMIELIVVIAVMAVLIAVLAPALLSYVEESRMQRDESAMDEVVNSVQLAMADAETFDEVFSYSIPNNYVTYTDSSGAYGSTYTDEEFWAPDGSAHAVTITFNPDANGNYDLSKGVVNDMTNGNGSVADSRTTDELKSCTLDEMGNQKLYSAVQQTIGKTLSEKSSTYKNSSYTLFIRFSLIDGMYRTEVYGSFNGTNLSPDCQAAVGSGTSEYTPEGEAIVTKPTGGTQAPVYSNSDLQGSGGGGTPSYNQPAGEAPEPTLPPEPPKDPALNPVDGTTPADGDVYSAGDYEYCYGYIYCQGCAKWGNTCGCEATCDGWAVRCINDVEQPGPILESINGEPVTTMQSTFADYTNLTVAPVIPAGVTNMVWTFGDCTNLTTAPIIPAGVTDMDSTFYGCTNLTTAPVIPNSVTDMESTFKNCTNLTTAPEIPNSVTDMIFTFYNCTNLTVAPEIPNSVTNMRGTFYGCTNLTTAPVIPAGVTNMNTTFRYCTNLTVAPEIPAGVTDISAAFSGCTNLTTAPVIPAGVTNMVWTFNNCTGLTGEISIPCSLASKNYTYTNCPATITYYHIDGCDGSCGQ